MSRLSVCLLIIASSYLESVHSQNHIFTLDYRFGISPENFSKTEATGATRYNYRTLKALNETSIIFTYRHSISKWNFFLSTGLEYSTSNHILPIHAWDNQKMILEYVHIQVPQLRIRYLGVLKQFSLVPNKFNLNLSVDVVGRIPLDQSQNFKRELGFSDHSPWIEYSYDITTYNFDHRIAKHPKLDFGLSFDYSISEKISAKLGFSFTRENIVYYNYKSSSFHYINGSDTPSESYNFNGVVLLGREDTRNNIEYNLIFLNLGVNYAF